MVLQGTALTVMVPIAVGVIRVLAIPLLFVTDIELVLVADPLTRVKHMSTPGIGTLPWVAITRRGADWTLLGTVWKLPPEMEKETAGIPQLLGGAKPILAFCLSKMVWKF